MRNVRSAIGAGGALEERYEYDAFGQPYMGDLSSGMNLGYTGKPYDPATGLYNYVFRDYQPAVARFTTVDPVRDGNNWFTYVNNDPVNWVDSDGLIGNVLAGAGIGTLIGGASGALSAVAQGKSGQEILAGAIGGAISGAITGAAIGSGIGIVGLIGAGFAGGAVGSVAEDVLANGGPCGLNPVDVAKNAVKNGAISVAATVIAGVGLPAVGNATTNKAWNMAASLTATMNGTWGPAAQSAYTVQKVAAAAKPAVEIGLTTLFDVFQDITGFKTQPGNNKTK
jgi:RHS repeat-associated protein